MTTHRPPMPDFAAGSYAFQHSIDSALRVLQDLDVPPSSVTIRMAGAGRPARSVVTQTPAPGTPIDGAEPIVLSVAGFGCSNALPVGMWDRGASTEPGTFEIVDLFDDPLQKAAHWLREGARLFDVKPDNLDACSRWIALFGLDPGEWPPTIWYSLALLLPALWRTADTHAGIRLAFRLLLELPVRDIHTIPNVRQIAAEDQTRLGVLASRLSLDCTVGSHIEDLSGLRLVIGPVPLTTYYEFHQPSQQQLLAHVIDLCVSSERHSESTWLVSDATRSVRLGHEAENGRLGINSYLRQPAEA
jgi:hypothetical protein